MKCLSKPPECYNKGLTKPNLESVKTYNKLEVSNYLQYRS